MRQFFSYCLFILLIATLASCDQKKVFEAYHKIDENGWNKDSVVVFNVTLTDTIKNNNLLTTPRDIPFFQNVSMIAYGDDNVLSISHAALS